MTFVVYVSGHGYGHAVRTARILECVRAIQPDCRLLVRTLAPAWLFPHCQVTPTRIDGGVVESADTLSIDNNATFLEAHEFGRQSEQIMEAETAFVRHEKPDLLVADIPYVAGQISKRSGIPCIAIGNFTWDWIYEPILGYGSDLLQQIRESYREIPLALRLPFCQTTGWNMFDDTVDVPLVCRPPGRSRRFDYRPTVFLAGRGLIPDSVLDAAALEAEEFFFVSLGESPSLERNRQTVRMNANLTFTDVLASCDIVLAKLGYSLVADCIASGKRLVYPPRTGFRENSILESELGRHLPSVPLSLDQYNSGQWSSALRAVSELPILISELALNGAEICAERLILECQ